MKQTQFTLIFLITLFVLALAVAILIFWVFLQPVAFAIILSVGLYPLQIHMQRWVKSSSSAALLSTLVVLLILVLPAGLTAASVGSEMVSMGRRLSERSRELGGVKQLASETLQKPLAWLTRHVDLERTGIQDWLNQLPARTSGILVSGGTWAVSGFAGFAGQTAVTFFVLFFLFRDGPLLLERIASLMPLREAQVDRLFTGMRNSIIANLYGILAVGIVQGTLTGVALSILGIPAPLLLGVLAGFSSMVPLVGTALVWLPAAIYLLARVSVWKGVALLLWGALVVGTSDHIVRPLIVKGKVKIHPLLLLFSILGGLHVFGFLGIFIGPLVLSLLSALVEILREEVRLQRIG